MKTTRIIFNPRYCKRNQVVYRLGVSTLKLCLYSQLKYCEIPLSILDDVVFTELISLLAACEYTHVTNFTFHPLTDYKDLLACEQIQRAAWNMTGDRDIVPAHLLSPVIKHGGLALGAFNNDQLIGFVFGFLGKVEDERAAWMGMPYVHCSEMMGILPDYQSQSVGYQLKLLQREYALQQGHHLMIWTFDPLLSRNAWLNIGKLGCIVRHYIRDAYGDMGGIYAGLSTDRFEAEWWLQSEHVSNRITKTPQRISIESLRDSGAEIINPGIPGENSVLHPSQEVHAGDESVVLVETPGDFQSLKQKDLGAAKAWRQHTRALFEALFEAGYLITNFVHVPDQQIQRSYYVLNNNIQVPDMAESK